MVRIVIIILGMSLVILISGCSTGISDKNLVYVTTSEAVTLLEGENNSLFGGKNGAVLVDPRIPWQFSQGHIPGAMNLPLESLFLDAWKLEGVGVIIVSGHTWNDSVAIAMSKDLLKRGFTDVRTLKGGLTGWTDSGREVEKGL